MIKNETKDSKIADNIVLCKTSFSKAKGLMFSKKIKKKGLVFEFSRKRKVALHMCFVFFSIDVLFLNENKEVVDLKENFRPFTLYSSKKDAKYAIELPSGTISASGTASGDKISF